MDTMNGVTARNISKAIIRVPIDCMDGGISGV